MYKSASIKDRQQQIIKMYFFNPICLVKQLRKIFVLLVRTIYQYQARFFHLRTSIVFVFLIFLFVFEMGIYCQKSERFIYNIKWFNQIYLSRVWLIEKLFICLQHFLFLCQIKCILTVTVQNNVSERARHSSKRWKMKNDILLNIQNLTKENIFCQHYILSTIRYFNYKRKVIVRVCCTAFVCCVPLSINHTTQN